MTNLTLLLSMIALVVLIPYLIAKAQKKKRQAVHMNNVPSYGRIPFELDEGTECIQASAGTGQRYTGGKWVDIELKDGKWVEARGGRFGKKATGFPRNYYLQQKRS